MCGRESVCVCVAGFVSVCETSQLFSLNVGAPHTTSATAWLPRRCFECFCPCFVFHSSPGLFSSVKDYKSSAGGRHREVDVVSLL